MNRYDKNPSKAIIAAIVKDAQKHAIGASVCPECGKKYYCKDENGNWTQDGIQSCLDHGIVDAVVSLPIMDN